MFDFTPDIDCVYFIISGLSSKSGRFSAYKLNKQGDNIQP